MTTAPNDSKKRDITLRDLVQPDGTVSLVLSSFPVKGVFMDSLNNRMLDPARWMVVQDPTGEQDDFGRPGLAGVILFDPPGKPENEGEQIVKRILTGFHGRQPTGMVTFADGTQFKWMQSSGCGCGARLKSGRIPWDYLKDTKLRVVQVSDRAWIERPVA